MNGRHDAISFDQVLERAQDELCFPVSDDHIVKAEITRKGVVRVELSLSRGRHWFEFKDNEFRELKPIEDRKVPLAARLENKSFKWQAKLLAYRPGKRLTLIDQSGEKPHIVKGFRRGRLDEMIRKYELAHRALSGRGMQTPEIIEYDRKNEALVMAYQEGDELHLAPETTDLFQLAGEALRAFQDFPVEEKLERFLPRRELDVIEQRADRLCSVGGELPDGFVSNRRRLEDCFGELPPPTWGLAHRDLHDRQFIQRTNHLVLLDFDLLTVADTTLDAANFLAHLVLRQMQRVRGATQRGVDQSGKKLLRGLGRSKEPGFWRRLRFYQATTFTRLALVYRVRPRWAHLTDDLLQISGRCLDDFDRIREG